LLLRAKFNAWFRDFAAPALAFSIENWYIRLPFRFRLIRKYALSLTYGAKHNASIGLKSRYENQWA